MLASWFRWREENFPMVHLEIISLLSHIEDTLSAWLWNLAKRSEMIEMAVIPYNSPCAEERYWDAPWTGPDPDILSGSSMSSMFSEERIYACEARPSLNDALLAPKSELLSVLIWFKICSPLSDGKCILPHVCFIARGKLWNAFSRLELVWVTSSDTVYQSPSTDTPIVLWWMSIG